jgi:hypothetical protein
VRKREESGFSCGCKREGPGNDGGDGAGFRGKEKEEEGGSEVEGN